MQNTKKPRGFAAMDPKVVRAISSKGGKSAHALGRAHQFTSKEARIAGRKGGAGMHRKNRPSKEPTTMRCVCGHVQTLPFESFRSLPEQLTAARCLSCARIGNFTHVKDEEDAA